MPTIYNYTTAHTVSQARYNVLINRIGWYATSTPPTPDATMQLGGVAKADLRLAGKFAYPRPRAVTHVTSMQSGHGWTASGALANGMNDGTNYALGSQSAFITSNTAGQAATITKTGLALDISATKQLRLLVRAENSDNINGCSLYISSDSMVANFAFAPIQNIVADPGVRWLKDGEWKWVTVNLGSATVTGSPNYAAIDSLRIRLTSVNGTSATIRLQAVQVVERKSFASGGIICFTYDDSYRTQYTLAKPHLDKWGFAGTAFTISSNVKEGDAGNSGWMTTQMLKDLRNHSGWEMALHTHTIGNHSRAFAAATNATSGTAYGTNPLTSNELDHDITQNLEFLTANDLTDGFVGHCYPQGRFNASVSRQMARRVAYARAMTGNSNGMETVPPADPYAIRSYTLDNTSVLGTLQGIVDSVALHGGMAVFCCHDIVTSPTLSTQVATATHSGLVDYVAGKAGVRVMTLGDVMRGLSGQG